MGNVKNSVVLYFEKRKDTLGYRVTGIKISCCTQLRIDLHVQRSKRTEILKHEPCQSPRGRCQ